MQPLLVRMLMLLQGYPRGFQHASLSVCLLARGLLLIARSNLHDAIGKEEEDVACC